MKLEIKQTHCTAGRIAFGQMHGLNTDESYKDKDLKRVEEGTRKLTDLLQLRHLVAHPAEVHHHRRLHHACQSWTTMRRCNHCYSPGSHRADSRYAVGNLGKYLKKNHANPKCWSVITSLFMVHQNWIPFGQRRKT